MLLCLEGFSVPSTMGHSSASVLPHGQYQPPPYTDLAYAPQHSSIQPGPQSQYYPAQECHALQAKQQPHVQQVQQQPYVPQGPQQLDVHGYPIPHGGHAHHHAQPIDTVQQSPHPCYGFSAQSHGANQHALQQGYIPGPGPDFQVPASPFTLLQSGFSAQSRYFLVGSRNVPTVKSGVWLADCYRSVADDAGNSLGHASAMSETSSGSFVAPTNTFSEFKPTPFSEPWPSEQRY